jgi:hypothetical protein
MRILKISEVFQYMNTERKAVYAPFIRLRGKWLEALGFHAGCKVEVLAQHGEITLKLIKGE